MSNLKEEYALENKFEEFLELEEKDRMDFFSKLTKVEDGEKIIGRIFYSLPISDKSTLLEEIIDNLFYTKGEEATKLEEMASIFRQNITESELIKLYQELNNISIIIDGSEL